MTSRYYNYEWYTREDIDWVYVRVKRTGSSWIIPYLIANGFNQIYNFNRYAKHHKLVILREPLERFVSGAAINDDFIKKVFNNPRKALIEHEDDSHITPQVRVLKSLDLNNCTFIKYDKNLVTNLQRFLDERQTNLTVTPPSTWYNKVTPFNSNGDISETDLDENLKDRFRLQKHFEETPKFSKIIMDYLKEDYDFYNKVNWYGTNKSIK